MDQTGYQKQIELEILKIIEDQLNSGQMDASHAQEIAQYVLQNLPENMTLNQIYKLVPKLSEQFSELNNATAPVIKEYEEKAKNIALPQIREMLQQGNFTAATQIVKQTLNRELPVL
jgi:hypothetical protein